MSDLSSNELVTKISIVPVHLAAAHCSQLWSRTFIDRSIHLVLDPPRGCPVVLGIQAEALAARLLPAPLLQALGITGPAPTVCVLIP